MPQTMLKEGVIRRVSGAERQDFRDHLLRLSPTSRRSRFAGAVSDLFVEQHVDRLFSSDAIVFGWFVDGVIRAAAELHPVGGPWKGTAEVAFSVEEGNQDSGVGTALLGRVMRVARNRGISRLIMTCLPENGRMQRVARKYGARLEWHEDDVLAHIHPPVPTPLSVWREVVDEGEGFMNALFPTRKIEAAE